MTLHTSKNGAIYLRRSLDTDGSGRITVSELQDALASLGVPVDAAIAGRMVDLIDVDGSSDISFQEFRRFAVLLPQAQVMIKATGSPVKEELDSGPRTLNWVGLTMPFQGYS